MATEKFCSTNTDPNHINNSHFGLENIYIIYGPNSGLNENKQPLYENTNLNKNHMLRKLFRNAGRADVIYENLCHGCGYGVFEAKSNLCTFCSCVVDGLKNNTLTNSEIYANTGENIYENICHKCSALYSTDECETCLANENIKTIDKDVELETKEANPIMTQKHIKIKKSKSFHKFDKHNLINGIFGSLKRSVTIGKNNSKEKRLDIVHHVDGYDNIFHTNETFDLKKICELKHEQKNNFNASTSDQHIYGRLKMSESSNTSTEEISHSHLSKSHDQLQVSNLEYLNISCNNKSSSIPAIRQTITSSRKRPRISKLSLLNSKPKLNSDDLFYPQNNTQLALPLSDSICYWMKILRKQVYNYYSFGASFDDEQYDLCIPKSIPPKSMSINIYCSSSWNYMNSNLKAFPTNFDETMTNIPIADKKGVFSIPVQANSSCTNICEHLESYFAAMVNVFKQNIISKHMLYQQRELEPSVDHSNTLNAITQQEDRFMRSEHTGRVKYQTINMNEENDSALAYALEHRPISIMNSKQSLSTVAIEKYSTSCCSACHVATGKSNRCGCLSVGDSIPLTRDSEFQYQTVSPVKKFQNKTTKTNTIIKTETADASTSTTTCIVESGVSKENTHSTKQINYFPNLTDNIDKSLYVLKETNCELTFNTVQQVAAFAQSIEIPYKKVFTWNIIRLINNILISCSLNTIVLHCCSNRIQYFDWFQDWLLCYHNPFSYIAKLALKFLANYNSFDIACKLWALLHESVKRQNYIWKYGKQGERVCIGETPISGAHAQIVMKYRCVTLQSDVKGDVGLNERKSENIFVSTSKTVSKNSSMKTNDEVVLRPKSKDSLERGTKAQGKFLDLDENVVELNRSELKLTNDKSKEKFGIALASCNDTGIFDIRSIPITSPSDIPNNCHNNNNNNNKLCTQDKEEDIYQPIWEFKTVGNVSDLYESDPECYGTSSRNLRTKSLKKKTHLNSDDSSIPSLLISDNVEDHGEWETDDEFMFSKKLHECSRIGDTFSSQKTSSSTIASFDDSTTDIDSSTDSNLQHPLLRTVCIYFSLSDPKIRAIVYDYDRAHASQYFKNNICSQSLNKTKESIFHTPLKSMDSPSGQEKAASSSSTTLIQSESGKFLSTFNSKSVEAWKDNLLNPTYVEDEEDLIVSESEILRSQLFKEEEESASTNTKTATLQRFKSASFGNLLDVPREDDKKSITERMRNKLQRGVFKLNMRSPKSEKKGNGIFRSVKTGSLYLEEGMRPKFPIFGAPLEQLEMNESLHQQVPRFVVDCVSYIERRECILQDGLYRASGNKLAIDELKQKLSESYIYDTKLLVADDIHTITSLLKQFFRELGTPLIPQSIYDRISRDILESAGIELLRNVIEEIPDPNRSTLKFLIRHLKNVAAFSIDNRMPASNLAIVWGPCIFSANQLPFVDIGRMNTLTKLLIENYDFIFRENERLVN